ncbi:hypothetical protein Tco_0394295, partial [Tanacetum coccineum]
RKHRSDVNQRESEEVGDVIAILLKTLGYDLSDGVKELRNDQQFDDFLAVDDDDVEDYDEDECELDDMSLFVGKEDVIILNSKVDRKRIKEIVEKDNGKEKVAEGKGKDKVVEGKGKKKVVEGSTVDVDGKASRKKWTKQGIKMAMSPSKKGIKKKTSYHVCKFRLWGSLMQNEASFQRFMGFIDAKMRH